MNPLTPKSDRYVTSPYIFNTVLSRHAKRMKKIINREYGLDITPNSQDLPTQKCMVLVRGI